MINEGWKAEKKQLEGILERDEYTAYLRNDGRNPVIEWLERMWRKVLDLFPDTAVPPGTPKVLAYVLLGILLAVLVAAIVWLARSLILLRRSRRRSVFRSAAELDRSFAALLREAEECAAEGNYPEAVRRTFLAMLLLMDEREWVRAERWKTNREYEEELYERQPGAVESFKQAASLFELVYYGGGTAGAHEYGRMTELLAPYRREEADYA
ncbi:DUF4129 domain-containing protein [Paenibacillus elgii]